MNDDAVRLFTLYARPSALTRAVLQRGARRPRVHPLAHLCHLNCVSAELGYARMYYHDTRVQYVRKSADRGYTCPVYPRASAALPRAANRRGNTTLLGYSIVPIRRPRIRTPSVSAHLGCAAAPTMMLLAQ